MRLPLSPPHRGRPLLCNLALAYNLALVLAAAVIGPAAWVSGAQGGQPAAEVPWYQRCLIGMEVGPTGAQFGSDPSDSGYAARFDGREIVRRQVEAHSEYLVIWARDGEYAYYNSKIMPKCPGLGSRDVLRETVEEAAKHKLPVIAYCVVQQAGDALRKHPEFAMRDAEGKPIGRFCFNTGYLDYMKGLVAEMLAYGIDGFHIDMLDQGFGPPYGCWCTSCQTRFRAEYGKAMPKGVTWDDDWDRMLQFRYNTSARFEKALREHVRSLSPRASVDFNYHGYPPFSWEVGQRPVQHAHVGDFVTGETGVWGFSALGVSQTCQFLAATKPGAIYQIAMQRGVRMYHDQTTRPLNDLRWELFALLAHGTRVTLVDKTGYDGWLDPVAYERIGVLFQEARAKREHFGHRPVQEVGLYYSSRSRDWYGRATPAHYQQSFHGAHKALVYEHIPLGILLDENLTPERLRQFPIVFLPNAAILSDDEIKLFRRYVEEGGNLLVTGLSGLLDRLGNPRKESALAEVIGATFVRKLDSLDNHVRFASAPPDALRALSADIPGNWPFLVEGPAAVLKPTTATAVGELMQPHRTVLQKQGREGTSWPMSADRPVGPAILFHPLGKGKVLTLACSPDFATAGEHPVVETRRLLRNAVRLLNPEPPVRVTAPANVEAVITEDAASGVLRVHLLGYLSPPATTPAQNRPYVLPSLIEDPPLYRAVIEVRRPFKTARAWNKETLLKAHGNRVEVQANNVHEIVVLEN